MEKKLKVVILFSFILVSITAYSQLKCESSFDVNDKRLFLNLSNETPDTLFLYISDNEAYHKCYYVVEFYDSDNRMIFNNFSAIGREPSEMFAPGAAKKYSIELSELIRENGIENVHHFKLHGSTLAKKSSDKRFVQKEYFKGTYSWTSLGDTIRPCFFGGAASMDRFIKANIDNELIAKANVGFDASDRVICEFTVDSIGVVRGIKVVQGIHPVVDREAVRVISQMPKWMPGVVNGQTVALTQRVAIDFDATSCDSIYDSGEMGDNSEYTLPEYEEGNKTLLSHLFVTEDFLHRIDYEIIGGHAMTVRVVCNFIIDKDGKIGSIKIKRSVDPIIDRIALLVVSNLGQWKPGKHNGVPVCARYTVPVSIRL